MTSSRLSALTKDAFTIGALTPGDGIHKVDPANFPIQTGANVIGATIDTMTVTFTDLLADDGHAESEQPAGGQTECQSEQQHGHLASAGRVSAPDRIPMTRMSCM